MNRPSYILLCKSVIVLLLLILCSCVKSGLDESFLYPSDYISFRASLVAETRTASCGTASYISIEEQSWPLCSSDADVTRGAPIYTLNGLDVGMFASKYDADNRYQGDVMFNLNFQFIDNEELRAVGTPVLWDSVSDAATMKVYGYAPMVGDSDANIGVTSSGGVTTISYVVPEAVTDQVDIIATRISEVSSDYRQNIPLTFEHILTGIRFKAGFDCSVTSLRVVNVMGAGEYVIGDVWSGQSAKMSFTLPIESSGRSCSSGSYITNDEEILMMIPQQLGEDAYVEMVYTDTSGEHTIAASLAGLKWEIGSLITYTINRDEQLDYVYFDLSLGNVHITPTSYSGYVNVGGAVTHVSATFDASAQSNYRYYIYQSTPQNMVDTGWESAVNVGACRIPTYDPIMVDGAFWSDYITNNKVVENVIEKWDTAENIAKDVANTAVPTTATGAVRASGRVSTPYNIVVIGDATNKIDCEITIDNIYSRYQLRGSVRTRGGLTFLPDIDYSKLVVNALGDNRFGNIHYFSGRNSSGLYQNNRLYLRGTGSMTMACVDFYKGTSGQSSSASYKGDNVYTYFSNYWCSAIGGDDGSQGNTIGLVIQSGTIFAGTTQSENCTAIGGGGNDRGYVDIEGGTVTAVATTTGTAIGGGIGFNSSGGIGQVKISGGTIYAYNHANEWEIPSAAIGSAGSWASSGGSGTVEITGGYVYAEAALGTAIGGGSSKTRQGGSATVTISNNSYVIAKSIPALDKYTNTIYPAGSGIGGGTGGTGVAIVGAGQVAPPAYGGSAKITITGNPTIRTGSIGGGKTNNPNGKIGNATIVVAGGDISAQFIMAGGAATGQNTTFDMSGGTISNSYVDDKEYYHASNYGGAVYMEDGYFTMTGGTIRNCTADIGGAVYIKKSNNALVAPQFNMSGGVIEDCVSATHGGAIYLEGGAVKLSAGTIQRNLALEGNGGGVYIAAGNLKMPEGGSASVIYNSAQLGHTSTLGNGGGIYVTSSTSEVDVEVYSGSILNNTSDKNGGGICVDMSGNDSVANVVVGSAGNTSVDNPDISNNAAVMYGGGLYAIGENAKVTINGGCIIDNTVVNHVPNENVTNQRGTVVLNGGDVTHVVVTFDANASDATVDGASEAYQNIVTATNSFLVQPLSIQRNFYNFVNWNTRPDGMGVTYTDGQLMNISEDMTLYAQWVAQ